MARRPSAHWALLVLAWAVPVAAQERVVPGGVARWEGDGITACHMGERSFPPLADACVFPVDLLTAGATLAVARDRAGQREQAVVAVAPYPYPEQRLTVDEKFTELSPADQVRVARENAAIAALWTRASDGVPALPLAAPLAPLPEGGRFGARRVFNGERRNPHSGVDYAAPLGAPVYAVGDGTVVLAENHFFAGNSVFIDHGGELITMYFHLDRMAVTPGTPVRRGEVVGTVGASGRATGPHLHFGARWHGARIDPRWLMAASAPWPTVTAVPSPGAP